MIIGPVRETILWGHEAEGPKDRPTYWSSLFASTLAATFAEGTGKRPIVRLRVREPRDGELAEYWAWWSTKDSEFMFVFQKEFMVDMCFTYGAAAETERGRGRIVNVIVEPAEQIVLRDEPQTYDNHCAGECGELESECRCAEIDEAAQKQT